MNKFKEKPLQILVATGLEPLPVDFDSKADYDNDGKPNDEEVNWNSELIKNEKLPSILECMRSVEKPYVEQGLDRYIQSNINNLYSNLENVYILPIRSDPTNPDSDGDGFYDEITGKYKPIGYYQVKDKWPLTDKPHQAFYQEEGEYYFNQLLFPKTSVGNYPNGYGPQRLDLSKDEQKYIYELCEVANNGIDSIEIDPLLVISICAHETGCTSLVNDYGYCGYMQFYYDYSDEYCHGQYYKGTVKMMIDKMYFENRLSDDELYILQNSGLQFRKQKEEILKRNYVGITFGSAMLFQFNSDKSDDWQGLRNYCSIGDTHSAYEDIFYRNTLAKLIGEEIIYESKYKTDTLKYYITINGVDIGV